MRLPIYPQGSPPAVGTYTSPQTLTITEAIPGSTIYYELTGAVSTNGSVQYTGPVSLSYGGLETLQTYATETGYEQTNYLLAQYTINIPVGFETRVWRDHVFDGHDGLYYREYPND